MSGINHVELRGTVNVYKSGAATGEKKAWVRASIRPEAGKASIPVKAFGEAAEKLGNAHELTVTASGHISFDKPREETDAAGKKIPWPMIVVIEKVSEIPPRGLEADGPEAQEEGMPF